MEFSVMQIAAMLGGEVKGDGNRKVHMLGKIQEAKKGEISFLSNPKYENYLYTTEAEAVIVKNGYQPKKDVHPALIYVEDPYTSFSILLEEYHKLLNYSQTGIEEPSFIGSGTTVGENIYRGAFSYIGKNVKIGNNVMIYPQAYIGDDVEIGDNTIIHTGAKVYARNKIGAHCILHAGVVIGSDGFGFAPQPDGTYKTIPQLGKVVIEDFVSIGANTTIDCATLHGDATIIRSGVKLDNLIQIAHNVEVGKNTVIAAQTGISGSAIIGENCIIGGQVGIAGHIKLADKTGIGAQSGVSKPTSPGQKIFGSPGFDLTHFLRSYGLFKKLPDLEMRLKELEEKILTLPTFQEK